MIKNNSSTGYFSDQLLKSFGILCVIVVLVCSAALFVEVTTDIERDDAAAYSALVLVVIACAISFHDIRLHLKNYNRPLVQKHVVRMLLMVPIYAAQSWLSLRVYDLRLVFETLRDLYEAFVIATFIYYAIELMGGWVETVKIFLSKPASLGLHPKWLTCGKEIEWAKMGEPLLVKIEYSALQYVVIKVFTTILVIFTEYAGIYNEGNWNLDSAYIYISLIVNFSQCYALYGLGMMYIITFENLSRPKNWRPLGKFACIKGIVFFTWWQGFFINMLQVTGAFTDVSDTWSEYDVAHGIQNYLICIEMLFFSITHHYVFTYAEYEEFDGEARQSELIQAGSQVV